MGKPGYAAISGTGVWMVDLAIQLYSSAFPDTIKPHPHVIVGLGIVGLVLLLYALVGWLIDRHHPTVSPAGNSGIQSERDNSGHQIIAGRDVYVGAPQAPSVPVSEKPNGIERHTARLEMSLEQTWLIYSLESCTWVKATEFDNERREALIVWFINPVPPKGARGVEASQLSGHITFSVNHFRVQIPQAYWIDHSENEVTIAIGHRAGLILGMTDWDNWASYSNPYRSPAEEEFLQPAFRRPGKKEQMPKADMDAEVSLISGTTTMEQRKIRLTFAGGRPYGVAYP